MQVFWVEQGLNEADGEFVVLLGNNVTGRVTRALGPISGRLAADELAGGLLDMYRHEFSGVEVEWTATVVPLETDVEKREQEIEWITSGRADEEAAATVAMAAMSVTVPRASDASRG